MRTKKIKNPAKLFGPSAMPSVLNVGIRADGHVSGMRDPSVMPSVLNVGNAVGIHTDGHVSGMRATTRRY
jgi:hypothetical protein